MDRRTLVDGIVDGIQGDGKTYAVVLSQVFVFDSKAAVDGFLASDLSLGVVAAASAAGGRPAGGLPAPAYDRRRSE